MVALIQNFQGNIKSMVTSETSTTLIPESCAAQLDEILDIHGQLSHLFKFLYIGVGEERTHGSSPHGEERTPQHHSNFYCSG